MANMLLFFTREAFFKFSIDDRLLGEGISGSKTMLFSLAGELGSRPCQKRRGEAVENGDDPAGEVSLLVNSFA
jgi:hypothetical protein